MRKQRNALAVVPNKPAPAIFERSLSITIEIGGHFMIFFQDNCLVTLLQNSLHALTRLPIKSDDNWEITLSYWHLDDDCIDVTVDIHTNNRHAGRLVHLLPPHGVLARMVDRCRAQFLRKLAKKQIQLVGKRGQLV